MEVWIPVSPPPAGVARLEGRAKVTVSFQNSNASSQGVNDGIEPKSSGEQPAALTHWWPHKGGEEWVQYTWDRPVTVAGSRVYWFDDTGRGECRIPSSWRIEYLEDGRWKAIESAYPVALDKWCAVKFPPVKTTALRLVVKMQTAWAAGIHEWQVIPAE
jgi:hypothetical protein